MQTHTHTHTEKHSKTTNKKKYTEIAPMIVFLSIGIIDYLFLLL